MSPLWLVGTSFENRSGGSASPRDGKSLRPSVQRLHRQVRQLAIGQRRSPPPKDKASTGRGLNYRPMGQTASSLSVDNRAHEAAVFRSESLDVAAASRAPLLSTRMVRSTRIPSEKALRLLGPK